MWSTNKALSADHPFASRPPSWPLLSRGLGFWNGNHIPKTEEEHKRQKEIEARKGVDPHYKPPAKTDSERAEEKRLREYYKKFQSSQIYLLGNPIVWFLSTASLLMFVGLTITRRMAERRGMSPTSLSIYHGQSAAGFFFISWLLHWVPFFAMQRQLFLHHYLPALYFAVLLLAVQVNHLFYISKLSRAQAAICAIVVGLTVAAFAAYAPLSYGLLMSKEYCNKIKLTSKWDFDCDSLKAAASL